MKNINKMRPTWKDKYALPLESMESIREKYCTLNAYKYSDFNKIKDSIKIDNCGIYSLFSRQRLGIVGIIKEFRYCPLCLEATYHSKLHQWNIFDKCFIHGCELIVAENTGMSNGNKHPILRYEKLVEKCIDNTEIAEEIYKAVATLKHRYDCGIQSMIIINPNNHIELNDSVKAFLNDNKTLKKKTLLNGKLLASIGNNDSFSEKERDLIEQNMKLWFLTDDESIGYQKDYNNLIRFKKRGAEIIVCNRSGPIFIDIALKMSKNFLSENTNEWEYLVEKYNNGDRSEKTVCKIAYYIATCLIINQQVSLNDTRWANRMMSRKYGTWVNKCRSGVNYYKITNDVIDWLGTYDFINPLEFIILHEIYKDIANHLVRLLKLHFRKEDSAVCYDLGEYDINFELPEYVIINDGMKIRVYSCPGVQEVHTGNKRGLWTDYIIRSIRSTI